jgi:hypothetical protein
MGFEAPSESLQVPSRRPYGRPPPLRFSPLQRFPAQGSRQTAQVCLAWAFPASPGFLNLLTPSSALSLPATVSDRIRSWGFPCRAFFLSRSRALFPVPLPSGR